MWKSQCGSVPPSCDAFQQPNHSSFVPAIGFAPLLSPPMTPRRGTEPILLGGCSLRQQQRWSLPHPPPAGGCHSAAALQAGHGLMRCFDPCVSLLASGAARGIGGKTANNKQNRVIATVSFPVIAASPYLYLLLQLSQSVFQYLIFALELRFLLQQQ